MPIAFITGFFGMNFFEPAISLEAWTGKVAFIIVVIVMLLVPFSMFYWMRPRGWM